MRTSVTLTLLAGAATSLRLEDEGGGVSYDQEGGGGKEVEPRPQRWEQQPGITQHHSSVCTTVILGHLTTSLGLPLD